MKLRAFVIVPMAIAVALCVGCGGGNAQSSNVPGPTPTPAPAPSPTPTPTPTSAAAGVTDTTGSVTLTANGLTLPVQLTDQDTGAPLTGVAVALGNDPSVSGSAVLLIADRNTAHPLQFVLLEGPSTSSSAQPTIHPLAPANVPTSVAVSNGCPLQSGATGSTAVTLTALSPPVPPTPAGLQTQLGAAIAALLDLNPSELPSGIFGPVSIQQFTPTVAGDCLNDLSTILQHEVNDKIQDIYLTQLILKYPILGPLEPVSDIVGFLQLTPEALKAAKSCWYQTGTPRTIDITEICFGECILIPQVEPLPQEPPLANLVVVPTVAPPVRSSLTFISSDNLGEVVVGTTDNTGTGAVQIPAGANTVCVDSPGFQQAVVSGFTASKPDAPLNVTLTPQPSPQQIGVNGANVSYLGGSVSCSNSGGFFDNCSGTVSLNVEVAIENGVVGVTMDQLTFAGANMYSTGTVPGQVVFSISGPVLQGTCTAGVINTDIEVLDGFANSTNVTIGLATPPTSSVPLTISCGPGT